tara:strand:- start:11 stop:115 length:105 start_codon:yes stop_codon:yes gene_type:complete
MIPMSSIKEMILLDISQDLVKEVSKKQLAFFGKS